MDRGRGSVAPTGGEQGDGIPVVQEDGVVDRDLWAWKRVAGMVFADLEAPVMLDPALAG